MSPTQVKPESANPSGQVGLVVRPRVIAAADANDVIREQLEFLIEHAQAGDCGCQQCERYFRVRTLLLEAFSEVPRTQSRAA
jgi:hypothetical protein